ncbi:MAG TPA: general secretion pathway protein GspK [Geobacter sp.]|nr:general secretion pathway protein GspK [Geobacter sp.]
MRGEKGFALVITLVVTALLVALLVEFVNEVYVDTSHSHNFVAAQQAGILAESGIEGGIKLLQFSSMSRLGEQYSSLQESWAKPQSFDAGEGTVTIAIEEESGKLNLNTATSSNGTPDPVYTPMAKRLFTRLKLPLELADSLMDWVDENDTPMPGGAETNYYGTLKLPYAAKNKRLETVDELLMAKGYTPEVLTKLRPLVTVYGRINDTEAATPININTADRDVIAALDEKLTDDLVQRIIDYRKTRPIKSIGDLNAITGMDTISPLISTKIGYLGNVYRIRAEGKVGESISVAEAVVRMAGGTAAPVVLYWREY